LPVTENWAFRLIRHAPGCTQLIASHRFLENDFYTAELECLRAPVELGASNRPGFRWISRWSERLSASIYPSYLASRLKSRHVDVVHSHFANIGWRYRKLAPSLDCAHVVSFYGWDYEHLATVEPKWKPRIDRLFGDADLVLCEGPYGAKTLARLGCAEDKIRVCRLGVEVDRIPFHARQKKENALNLLQLASFTEKKGHRDTIRAFAMVASTCPNSTLTLVGRGDRAIVEDIESFIRSSRLGERVRILPGIDFPRMHGFMRDFHVFIHPSRRTATNDCEGGAPVVLLDAQATGMPVISTRHCDIPDEVVDGETGVLAEEGDVPAIAAAIQRFYAMGQSEYQQFSARARAHVASDFNASTCSKLLPQLYSEAIEFRKAKQESSNA
jgi:colanic acid/amylovoran biosynthesis glycosyltransferase